MQFNPLLLNWKTTSAGLLSIIGGVTRLGFAIAHGDLSEEAVMTAATTILLGIGFLFTRDATVTSVEMGLQTVEKKSVPS